MTVGNSQSQFPNIFFVVYAYVFIIKVDKYEGQNHILLFYEIHTKFFFCLIK